MCCDTNPSAPAPQDNKFTDVLADIAQTNEARAKSTFWPLEDQAVQMVQKFNSQDWKNQQIGAASADVGRAFAKARATSDADEASMGINPADGMHGFVNRGLTIGQAGADAAATTQARRAADITGYDTIAAMSGRGAVDMNAATGAASAGGNQYVGLQQNQLRQEQINDQGMSGVGSLIGLGLSFMSSKKLKTNVRPFRGGLSAIRKMPVNSFQYKPGSSANGLTAPDDGAATHVGPMAEDFKDATGAGVGAAIPVQDALGLHQAAIKELDQKVSRLSRGSRPSARAQIGEVL
jgi:hypothetical protein